MARTYNIDKKDETRKGTAAMMIHEQVLVHAIVMTTPTTMHS